MLGIVSCSPNLLFLDGYQNSETNCHIVMVDNQGWQQGDLNFLSDSQFILTRHFVKDSDYDTELNLKRYYQLVQTPKEIQDMERR